MKKIELFTDSSVNPQSKIGFAAFLVKNDKDIIVIPAVGIPKSLNYELSSSFVEEIKKKKFENIFILYDATCVRDFWLRHLKWLDSSLVIKSLNILEVPTWLKN